MNQNKTTQGNKPGQGKDAPDQQGRRQDQSGRTGIGQPSGNEPQRNQPQRRDNDRDSVS